MKTKHLRPVSYTHLDVYKRQVLSASTSVSAVSNYGFLSTVSFGRRCFFAAFLAYERAALIILKNSFCIPPQDCLNFYTFSV